MTKHEKYEFTYSQSIINHDYFDYSKDYFSEDTHLNWYWLAFMTVMLLYRPVMAIYYKFCGGEIGKQLGPYLRKTEMTDLTIWAFLSWFGIFKMGEYENWSLNFPPVKPYTLYDIWLEEFLPDEFPIRFREDIMNELRRKYLLNLNWDFPDDDVVAFHYDLKGFMLPRYYKMLYGKKKRLLFERERIKNLNLHLINSFEQKEEKIQEQRKKLKYIKGYMRKKKEKELEIEIAKTNPIVRKKLEEEERKRREAEIAKQKKEEEDLQFLMHLFELRMKALEQEEEAEQEKEEEKNETKEEKYEREKEKYEREKKEEEEKKEGEEEKKKK